MLITELQLTNRLFSSDNRQWFKRKQKIGFHISDFQLKFTTDIIIPCYSEVETLLPTFTS